MSSVEYSHGESSVEVVGKEDASEIVSPFLMGADTAVDTAVVS